MQVPQLDNGVPRSQALDDKGGAFREGEGGRERTKVGKRDVQMRSVGTEPREAIDAVTHFQGGRGREGGRGGRAEGVDHAAVFQAGDEGAGGGGAVQT